MDASFDYVRRIVPATETMIFPAGITWNPADAGPEIALSGGYLVAGNNSGGAWNSVRATKGKTSGKWYWELTLFATDPIVASTFLFGIMDGGADVTTYAGGSAKGGGVQDTSNYNVLINGITGVSASQALFTSGDIWGVALDLDVGKLWLRQNVTWIDGNDPSQPTSIWAGIAGGTWYPACSFNIFTAGHPATITANFGATAFNQSIPAGFSAFG